jgi:branched-chain amino acid transport system permease protein
MIGFLIAGTVLGGIYAISAIGITLTYASSGVLNFAFGAEAYFMARTFYFLHTQHGWGGVPAAAVSVFVISPLLGLLLWATVFRLLGTKSSMVKVASTIGLSVALDGVAQLAYGNPTVGLVSGVAPNGFGPITVFGAAVSGDQLLVLICVAVVAVAGIVVLRRTDVGLTIRGIVDSEALTALFGGNPAATSAGVWTVTTMLAGLSGVLVAPLVGLASTSYLVVMSAGFAAVIAAKLKHLGRAAVVGLLIGALTGLCERYVPSGTFWASAAPDSIPFVVMLVALLVYVLSGQAGEAGAVGGFLDRAIAPPSARGAADARLDQTPGRRLLPRARSLDRLGRIPGGLVMIVIFAVLPLVVSGIWIGAVGEGFAFAVILLSYTLVAGEGRMIWLCQVSFAGIGAITAAEVATNLHWPVLLSLAAGGLITVPIGLAIGLLTIRLGDLYVALVTVTFALLMDNLVFPLQAFSQYGQGIAIARPAFAATDLSMAYLALAIFCLLGLAVVNLRRSTVGLALAAVRGSEAATRTVGLRPLYMKLLVAGCAAFVAGVGGALLSVFQYSAIGSNFATGTGLVWFAVLMTWGARSNTAACLAGLSFAILPTVFTSYLPTSVAAVPTVLFGIGAVMTVRNPDGIASAWGQSIMEMLRRVTGGHVVDQSAPAPQEVALAASGLAASGQIVGPDTGPVRHERVTRDY